MKQEKVNHDAVYGYAVCGLFAALTAIGAFIRIPIPLVPFTLQLMFSSLAGILLGAKRGAISQIVYVGVGLAGIPVFTGGGGIGYIFQPTFGYLIGFILNAYVIGKWVEKNGYHLKQLMFASLLGLMIVYILGVMYLYMIKNLYMGSPISIGYAIYIGALICLPGDVITCLLASIIGNRVLPILKRQQLV